MKRSIVAVLIICVLSFLGAAQVAYSQDGSLYMYSPSMDTDPDRVGFVGKNMNYFFESFRDKNYFFMIGFEMKKVINLEYFWSLDPNLPDYNSVAGMEQIYDYRKFGKYDIGYVFFVFDGERRNVVRVPSKLLEDVIVEISDDGQVIIRNIGIDVFQKSCNSAPPLAIADPVNPNHVRIPSENMLVDDNKNKVSCSIEPSVNIADIFDPKKVSVPSDDMLVDCDFCSPCPPLCLQNPYCPGFLMVPRDEVLVNK